MILSWEVVLIGVNLITGIRYFKSLYRVKNSHLGMAVFINI